MKCHRKATDFDTKFLTKRGDLSDCWTNCSRFFLQNSFPSFPPNLGASSLATHPSAPTPPSPRAQRRPRPRRHGVRNERRRAEEAPGHQEDGPGELQVVRRGAARRPLPQGAPRCVERGDLRDVSRSRGEGRRRGRGSSAATPPPRSRRARGTGDTRDARAGTPSRANPGGPGGSPPSVSRSPVCLFFSRRGRDPRDETRPRGWRENASGRLLRAGVLSSPLPFPTPRSTLASLIAVFLLRRGP